MEKEDDMSPLLEAADTADKVADDSRQISDKLPRHGRAPPPGLVMGEDRRR